MFALVQFIVATLLNGISLEALAAKRTTTGLTEIGTEVFLLYTSLNELLVTGHNIVAELEGAVCWLSEKVRLGETDRYFLTPLSFLLQQQGRHLLRFHKSLRRLALELEAMSPDDYTAIWPLIALNGSALGGIAAALLGSYDQPVALPTADAAMVQRLEQLRPAHNRPLVEKFNFGNEFAETLRIVPLGNVNWLGQDSLPAIETFLEEERPHEHLRELEAALQELRSSIERTFSLQDVLLAVGDQRAVLHDPWVR